MKLLEQIPWTEPLDFIHGIPETEENWALLYSGAQTNYSGRKSFLCLYPEEIIKGKNFDVLNQKLTSDGQKYENFWVGFLGYELKNCLESLPVSEKSVIKLPELFFFKPKLLMIFDHVSEKIDVYGNNREILLKIPEPKFRGNEMKLAKAANLYSNMTKSDYLQNVNHIKNKITNGEIYQANLTRKFYGTFENRTDPRDIFVKLMKNTPACYSAIVKCEKSFILSSSPEQFLTMDEYGYAESRPIKGTSPRFVNQAEDKKSLEGLRNSEKDKAENLMIVDLMRNDFGRGSEIGRVKVRNLFEVTTFSTIHHMSSTVVANRDNSVSPLKFVENCFPPASMTGTPKIKAMQIIDDAEKMQRGVYSGAIGYFCGDGSMDLSVVIRTLITNGTFFEFQVGGGIIFDSNANAELEETINKAQGILTTIGLSREEMEKI